MMRTPEQFRVTRGKFATDTSYGCNGFFYIPSDYNNRPLDVLASDGGGWEHVSVKVRVQRYTYTPTWDEMCLVKNFFWDQEDAVMQLHPRSSVSVNYHPNVLHLWRPVIKPEAVSVTIGSELIQRPTNLYVSEHDANVVWSIPEPPAEMVGPSGVSFLEREGL